MANIPRPEWSKKAREEVLKYKSEKKDRNAKSRALKGKKVLAGSEPKKHQSKFHNDAGRPSDSDYLGKF